MVTRITAGAFIFCGSKVLLMKRGLHKELGPGLWAGVGGHMELGDIKNPRALDLKATCLREVYEETGICKADIHNLKLRYIAIKRRSVKEMSFTYHFFGEMKMEAPLPKCDEGEFFWVDKEEILSLPMSRPVKEALRHWVQNPKNDSVYMIAVNMEETSAEIAEI